MQLKHENKKYQICFARVDNDPSKPSDVMWFATANKVVGNPGESIQQAVLNCKAKINDKAAGRAFEKIAWPEKQKILPGDNVSLAFDRKLSENIIYKGTYVCGSDFYHVFERPKGTNRFIALRHACMPFGEWHKNIRESIYSAGRNANAYNEAVDRNKEFRDSIKKDEKEFAKFICLGQSLFFNEPEKTKIPLQRSDRKWPDLLRNHSYERGIKNSLYDSKLKFDAFEEFKWELGCGSYSYEPSDAPILINLMDKEIFEKYHEKYEYGISGFACDLLKAIKKLGNADRRKIWLDLIIGNKYMRALCRANSGNQELFHGMLSEEQRARLPHVSEEIGQGALMKRFSPPYDFDYMISYWANRAASIDLDKLREFAKSSPSRIALLDNSHIDIIRNPRASAVAIEDALKLCMPKGGVFESKLALLKIIEPLFKEDLSEQEFYALQKSRLELLKKVSVFYKKGKYFSKWEYKLDESEPFSILFSNFESRKIKREGFIRYAKGYLERLFDENGYKEVLKSYYCHAYYYDSESDIGSCARNFRNGETCTKACVQNRLETPEQFNIDSYKKAYPALFESLVIDK